MFALTPANHARRVGVSAGRKGPRWKPVFPELNLFLGDGPRRGHSASSLQPPASGSVPQGREWLPPQLCTHLEQKHQCLTFSGAREEADAPWRGGRVGAGGGVFGRGAEDPAEAHAAWGARRGLLVGEREHGFGGAGAGLGAHGGRHGAGGPWLGASGEEAFGGTARAKGAVHLQTERQTDR